MNSKKQRPNAKSTANTKIIKYYALEVFKWYALYKFTFYLLTYEVLRKMTVYTVYIRSAFACCVIADKSQDARAVLWWMIAIYWTDFPTLSCPSLVCRLRWGDAYIYRVHIWYGITRTAGLQSGEGPMMIDSVVWPQYINVTDTQTDT